MLPLFTTRCLHVRHDLRDPSGGSGNCGGEWLNDGFHAIFYMPQIYDMGPTALLPLRRKVRWGFFSPLKIRRLRPASTLPLDHRRRLYKKGKRKRQGKFSMRCGFHIALLKCTLQRPSIIMVNTFTTLLNNSIAIMLKGMQEETS